MDSIKLVIFDLDGTLLYTIKDITVALNYALGKHNLEEVSIDDALYMVGNGTKGLISKAIKGNDALYEAVRSDYKDYYLKHNNVYTNPYQGIMHLLKMLKAAKVKLAVLSNKTHQNTVDIINYYFPNYFDYVLGSKDNIRLKPEVDGVNEVINYFNIDKDNILYLGDSEVDVTTARNANLLMGACLWGYRTKDELAGANLFFNSPKEIENYVLKNNDLLVNGAIILDKPEGITSQDALIKVKHLLQDKGILVERIGHAGTLDPLASGVLVVLLNEATKLSNYILSEDKEYMCVCKLGIETDTYDLDGKVIKRSKRHVSLSQIDEVLASFKGKQKQVPPAYSAIKLNGKKAYDLARTGKPVELDARDIEVYNIYRTSGISNQQEFEFVVEASKGTYIRSICHDLGLKLSTFGTVKSLRRIKSGSFNIIKAYTLDDIESGNFQIIDMVSLINLKKININKDIYDKVMNGKKLARFELDNTDEAEVALVYLDKLVAIYYYDENMDRYKARRVWK